jgi:hypothetical protein
VYNKILVGATIFALGCSAEEPVPSEPVTINCSSPADVTVNCNSGDDNQIGNNIGNENTFGDGSGGMGGNGGAGGTAGSDGGEVDIPLIPADDGGCIWQYNPGNQWEARCYPILENGKALASVRVKVDPANSSSVPFNKPRLAVIRVRTFDDQMEMIDQEEDNSETPEGWSAPHWIKTPAQEVVDLSKFTYFFLFQPYDGLDVGPIMGTEVRYDGS